jgi:hypothetical protein
MSCWFEYCYWFSLDLPLHRDLLLRRTPLLAPLSIIPLLPNFGYPLDGAQHRILDTSSTG